MIVKVLILSILKSRWTKLIDGASGFPDAPPENKCWIWKGNIQPSKGNDQPRASFLGQLVNPRHLLYGLHNNLFTEHPPRLRPTCGNSLCINPLHALPIGIVGDNSSEVPKFDPFKVDWSELFTTLGLSRSLSAEEIAEQTGAPIEAAQAWLSQ